MANDINWFLRDWTITESDFSSTYSQGHLVRLTQGITGKVGVEAGPDASSLNQLQMELAEEKKNNEVFLMVVTAVLHHGRPEKTLVLLHESPKSTAAAPIVTCRHIALGPADVEPAGLAVLMHNGVWHGSGD